MSAPTPARKYVCDICGSRATGEDVVRHPSDPETGASNDEVICSACVYDQEQCRTECYCVCCNGRMGPGDDLTPGAEHEPICLDCANGDRGEPDILHEAKDSIEAGLCREDFDYVEDAA